MPERCDMNTTSAVQRRLHQYRYSVAAKYIEPDDVVLDAACGPGYGRQILPRCKRYIGIDYWRPEKYLSNGILFRREEGDPVRDEPDEFIQVDLSEWTHFPISYDVCVSIETIEHIENYKYLVEIAKASKRLMIISTPITPTKHKNPFHVHDFTKESVCTIFEDDAWKLKYFEEQPGRKGQGVVHGIFVFDRQ